MPLDEPFPYSSIKITREGMPSRDACFRPEYQEDLLIPDISAPSGSIASSSSQQQSEAMILKPMSSNKRVIGKGTYGKVRRVENEQGQDFVVKVVEFGEVITEYTTLADLNYALGYMEDKKQGKVYLLMPNLGVNLYEYLINNPYLSDNQLFDIAIAICKKIHELQTGQSSISRTAYAHLDLKELNIMIKVQEGGNIAVHLVDFGVAEPNPHAIINNPQTTKNRLPPGMPLPGRNKKWYDVMSFRLSVSCFGLQLHADTRSDVIENHDNNVSLFSRQFVERHCLQKMFSLTTKTHSNVECFEADPYDNILGLMGILINRRYELNFDDDLINKSSLVGLLLLYMVEHNVPNQEMKDILSNPIPYLRSTLPLVFQDIEDSNTIQALFLCSQLDDRIDLNMVAKSKKHLEVVNILTRLRCEHLFGTVLNSESLQNAISDPDDQFVVHVLHILNNPVSGINPADHVLLLSEHRDLLPKIQEAGLIPHVNRVITSPYLLSLLRQINPLNSHFISLLEMLFHDMNNTYDPGCRFNVQSTLHHLFGQKLNVLDELASKHGLAIKKIFKTHIVNIGLTETILSFGLDLETERSWITWLYQNHPELKSLNCALAQLSATNCSVTKEWFAKVKQLNQLFSSALIILGQQGASSEEYHSDFQLLDEYSKSYPRGFYNPVIIKWLESTRFPQISKIPGLFEIMVRNIREVELLLSKPTLFKFVLDLYERVKLPVRTFFSLALHFNLLWQEDQDESELNLVLLTIGKVHRCKPGAMSFYGNLLSSPVLCQLFLLSTNKAEFELCEAIAPKLACIPMPSFELSEREPMPFPTALNKLRSELDNCKSGANWQLIKEIKGLIKKNPAWAQFFKPSPAASSSQDGVAPTLTLEN